jgi:hypothetical protein
MPALVWPKGPAEVGGAETLVDTGRLGCSKRECDVESDGLSLSAELPRPLGAPAESTNHRVTRVRSVRPLD